MLKAFLLVLTAFLPACSPPDDPPPVTPETAVAEAAAASPGRAPAAQRTITIAADPWCPHNCDAGAEQEGYMIEIAREAFALAKLDIEYVNMSWARALQQTDAGYINAVVGAFTGDAPHFIFPDEAIGYARTALFTHTDNAWAYRGVESLSEQKLVAINGYSYSVELDTYIEAHKDDPARVWILSGPAPLERAIELLEQHRSDILPEDLDVMRWTLEHRGEPSSLRMAAVMERLPVYIAFSPANPQSEELAALLTQGVRKLKASGRLSHILARYGVSWSD